MRTIAVIALSWIASIEPSNAGDAFGIVQAFSSQTTDFLGSVMSTGDLDGDGIGDLAGIVSVNGATQIRAISTATGATLFSSATMMPLTSIHSLRAAGDVDLDGVPDMIAASKLSGFATVISGQSGTTLQNLTGPSGSFGVSVDGVGDFDADGTPDVAVVSYYLPPIGNVAVYSGTTGALMTTIVPANTTTAQFGYLVAGLGDVNSDGYGDLVYSTHEPVSGGNPSASLLRVVHGPTGVEALTIASGQNNDDFGTSPWNSGNLVGGGDFDADGAGDILVGAWNSVNPPGTPKGAVWIFSGSTGTELLRVTPPAGSTAVYFGTSLASIPDFDGDGRIDFMAGDSSGKDPGVVGTNLGVIRTYSGANGALLRSIEGKANDWHMGGSLSGVGDTNGDGVPDLVTFAQTQPNVSSLIVISQTCGQVLPVGTACPTKAGFSPTLGVATECASPSVPVNLSILGPIGSPTIALLAAGTASAHTTIAPNCAAYFGGQVAVVPVPISFFGLGTIAMEFPYGYTGSVVLQAFLPAPGTALGYAATRGTSISIE